MHDEKLARRLYDDGAVKFGSFRLKLHETNPSAPLSPIYLNLRTANNPKPGPLSPVVVDQIGLSLYRLVDEHALDFTHVVGVPRAGDLFAEAFVEMAERMEKKLFHLLHLNKEGDGEKRHMGSQVIGSYEPGNRVLLVDDLVTKADSKLEAITTLEKVGLIVAGVVVLVDRKQGGAQQLHEADYPVLAAFTLSGLVDFYHEIGYIDQQRKQAVLNYLAGN